MLAVALLLSGALLALRWPRLVRLHLLVAGAIVAVVPNAVGAALLLRRASRWRSAQALA